MKSGMRSCFLTGLACLLLGGAVSADVKLVPTSATRDIFIQQEETKPDEIIQQMKVLELSRMDFHSSLVSNRTATGDLLKIGENLEVTFTSEKDCYLTLLDFTPSGKCIVLFPNKWASDNFVKANTPVKIPAVGAGFVMKSGGPAGTDVIKAVATLKDEKVFDLTEQKLTGPFAFLDDNARTSVMRDIVVMAEKEETGTGAGPDEKTGSESGSGTGQEVNEFEKKMISVPSLSVHTVEEGTKKGGFAVKVANDWVLKAWARTDSFKQGDRLMLSFFSNKPCKIVSLKNQGSSGTENSLLPEGQTPELKAGAIHMLPAKDDKWMFQIFSPTGTDTVTAKIVDEAGTEAELSFDLHIQ